MEAAGGPLAYCLSIVNTTGAGYEPVITVSATYGAAGSVVAPRVAAVLGLPFIDRLISADVSEQVAARSQEGLVAGEQEQTPTGWFLAYFARVASVGAVITPDPGFDDEDDIRRRSEEALAPLRAGRAGLVLGRAAAVALADHPRAFHLRLDGPVPRRIVWAAGYEQLDREAATRRQNETDRARATFVKRLYRADPADPALYHLVLDSTALGVDGTVEVVTAAATAFFRQHP